MQFKHGRMWLREKHRRKRPGVQAGPARRRHPTGLGLQDEVRDENQDDRDWGDPADQKIDDGKEFPGDLETA